MHAWNSDPSNPDMDGDGVPDSDDLITSVSMGTITTVTTAAGNVWVMGTLLGGFGTPTVLGEADDRAAYASDGAIIGLTHDNTVLAYGQSFRGQLGLGYLGDANELTETATARSWDELAAGEYHFLAIADDRTLWAGAATRTERSARPRSIHAAAPPAPWPPSKSTTTAG